MEKQCDTQLRRNVLTQDVCVQATDTWRGWGEGRLLDKVTEFKEDSFFLMNIC